MIPAAPHCAWAALGTNPTALGTNPIAVGTLHRQNRTRLWEFRVQNSLHTLCEEREIVDRLHRAAGASPEVATRCWRNGAALLRGKAEIFGIAQPREEKIQGDLTAALQCLKEPRRNMERDCLQGPAVTAQGGMDSS